MTFQRSEATLCHSATHPYETMPQPGDQDLYFLCNFCGCHTSNSENNIILLIRLEKITAVGRFLVSTRFEFSNTRYCNQGKILVHWEMRFAESLTYLFSFEYSELTIYYWVEYFFGKNIFKWLSLLFFLNTVTSVTFVVIFQLLYIS